jgi:hypothetical protein
MKYESRSGHIIESIPVGEITIYTECELDNFTPGNIVRTEDGSCYKIIELRHIEGRLWRVVLLPVKEA